jgi:hypothetical protein
VCGNLCPARDHYSSVTNSRSYASAVDNTVDIFQWISDQH